MPRKKALPPEESLSDRNSVDNGIPEETPETTIPRTVASSASTRLTLADYHALSIFEAMEKMTEEDWSDKMLYIVRSMPYTVNKNEPTKKHGSIHKGGFPGMNKEEIADAFGGYKFHLWLKMGKATLCEGWHDVDTEPKLLPTEQLVTPSETKQPAEAGASSGETQMAKVIQMLLEERKSKAESMGDTQTATAMQKAIELVASGAQQAQTIIANAGKAPTLNEQFEMAKNIMALAAPKGDDITKTLLLKLMDRAFTPAQPAVPVTNPIMEKLQERVLEDILEGDRPRGGGSDWKMTLVQMGMEFMKHLPTLARAIQQRPVIVMQPGARLPGAPPGAYPVYTPAPGPGPAGPEVAPAANPGDTFGGAPQPLDAPPESLTPNPESPIPALELAPLDQIQTRLVRMFYKGKSGDLAASFIEDATPALYEKLKGQTVDDLYRSLAFYPILAPLAAEPEIKAWLKELVEYIEEVEAEEPEPVAVDTSAVN